MTLSASRSPPVHLVDPRAVAASGDATVLHIAPLEDMLARSEVRAVAGDVAPVLLPAPGELLDAVREEAEIVPVALARHLAPEREDARTRDGSEERCLLAVAYRTAPRGRRVGVSSCVVKRPHCVAVRREHDVARLKDRRRELVDVGLPLGDEPRNGRLDGVGSLYLDAVLRHPVHEDVALADGDGERSVLHAEKVVLGRRIDRTAVRVEDDALRYRHELAIHDESAVIRLREGKDVDPDEAGERLFVSLLEGECLAGRHGESHLWNRVGGDDEPQQEIAGDALDLGREVDADGVRALQLHAGDAPVLKPHRAVGDDGLDELVPGWRVAAAGASSAAGFVSVYEIDEFHFSDLPVDHDCFVDRDVGEVFGLFPFPVCPHDPDAAVGVLVDSVYRTHLACAEALVDDASVVLDEERRELPLLEVLARRLEAVAVDLYLHFALLLSFVDKKKRGKLAALVALVRA